MAKLCCKNNHAQVFSSVNFREAFCTLTDPIGLALARNEATLKRGFAQPGWPKVYPVSIEKPGCLGKHGRQGIKYKRTCKNFLFFPTMNEYEEDTWSK